MINHEKNQKHFLMNFQKNHRFFFSQKILEKNSKESRRNFRNNSGYTKLSQAETIKSIAINL